MITFTNINKSFGEKRVLKGVTLTIPKGGVHFIIGTSGTGKSVLMKHAVGLLVPDAGACSVDGLAVDATDPARLDAVRKKCSYVFQGSALLDSMSVRENVALPLHRHHGYAYDDALAKAGELLAHVGARDAADRSPAQIGGGVRKQAAIARALAMRPDYLILDEPTTSLDPVSARRIDRIVAELAAEGVTIVVVSHDLKSIFGIADRIVFLYQGEVRANGTPDEIRAHPDPVLQGFLRGRPVEEQV